MRSECPTPGKTPWSTRAAAEVALRSIRNKGWSAVKPQRVYKCGCGNWHLSSSPKRRG